MPVCLVNSSADCWSASSSLPRIACQSKRERNAVSDRDLDALVEPRRQKPALAAHEGVAVEAEPLDRVDDSLQRPARSDAQVLRPQAEQHLALNVGRRRQCKPLAGQRLAL